MLGLLVILVGLLFGFLVGSPFPIHFPANRAPRQPDERVGFLSMNHLKMVDLIHNEIELTSNFLPSFLPSFFRHEDMDIMLASTPFCFDAARFDTWSLGQYY
jgi:hypothetical protein